MTNKRTTRRALLFSVLSMLLCVTMLMGTTFAWFTDSVSSMNNIIKSGNLDVELYYSYDATNWTSVEDNDKIFDENALWEPGYTEVVYLKVVNAGSLALKYQLGVNVFSEIAGTNVAGDSFKLSDYIEFGAIEGQETAFANRDTARAAVTNAKIISKGYSKSNSLQPKAEEYVALVVYMPETVNNVANHLTGTIVPQINLGINLLATQFNSEADSFGTDYDENAKYSVAEGETVVLVSPAIDRGVTNRGEMTVSGSTINNDGFAVENFGEATLNNVEINAGSPAQYGITSKGEDAILVLNDVEYATAGGGIGATDGAEVIFNSGKLDLNTKSTSGRYLFYAEGAGSEITINGGTFDFDKTQNQKRAYVYAGAGTTVTINSGTFGKASTRSGYTAGILGGGTVIIKGGTFGFDPTTWVADGYKVEKVNDTWTVSPAAANNADLDSAIKDGETTIALAAGTYIIPDSAQGKTLKIIGNGNTVIATQDDGSYEGCDYSLDGATVTFENITINTDSTTYTGYARCNGTYINCTINGTYTLYGDSVFENCTFNVSGDVYNIWTWGAPTATFTGCTFNSDGKAMLLYGTVNTKLTLNNCTFNDNGGLTDKKAAVEIGNDYNKSYELIVNNTVVNGYEINDKGINTGTTLWGNKNSMGTDKLNVVVDGVDVY
ncbi:MAG: hypothetical protein IKM48_03405 [Clostridia bacterium]|nr:hypothetical protein [Clostridia bacterium]